MMKKYDMYMHNEDGDGWKDEVAWNLITKLALSIDQAWINKVLDVMYSILCNNSRLNIVVWDVSC